MKIVIVGKTRMGARYVCVGGMSLDGKQSYRLMSKPDSNWPNDAPFQVGQIWEMDLKPILGLKPPHIEDVLVAKMASAGTCSKLSTIIRTSPFLWPGPLENIFDRAIQLTSGGKGYIERGGILPKRSTGFWETDRELHLQPENDKPYYFIPESASRKEPAFVKYVGVDAPPAKIPAGAFIRFSLAKWWQPPDAEVLSRCYLQLSGHFD